MQLLTVSRPCDKEDHIWHWAAELIASILGKGNLRWLKVMYVRTKKRRKAC